MSVTTLADTTQFIQVAIESQGTLLAVASTRQYAGKPAPGNRGVVNEFSSASRLRMLRKTARLDADKAVFLTLTYPSRFPHAREAKVHLRAFLERIRRRFPESSAIWRLEPQKRGAPHFHLIFFNLPFIPFAEVRRWWTEIISDYVDEWKPRARIELVRSKRGVMHYVSKYCAKVEKPGISLVSLSSAHNRTQPSIGRFWGVFNGPKLPFAERHYHYASVVTELCIPAIKRIMAEAWPKLEPDYRGAVVFSDKSEQLFQLMLYELIKDATYG